MPDVEEIIQLVKEEVRAFEEETGRSPTSEEVSEFIFIESGKQQLAITEGQKDAILSRVVSGENPPLFLKKIREDPDNCREFYRDINTGKVFVTAEGELHTVSDELEPMLPLKLDVKIVPPSCSDLFEKRTRGRLKSMRRRRPTMEEEGLEEGEPSPVRELPMFQIQGKVYFRDERLQEYRSVDDPGDRITFDQFEREGLELETPSRG